MMETATSGTDVRVGGRSSRRGRNQHLHADMPSAKLRRSPRKRPPAESGHKQYMKAFALFGLLLVAALFIAPMQSRADAASPAARLKTDGDAYTLVELTDLALRRNPKTSLAWAAIRSSEAGVELARAGYWPAIAAALSAQRNRALNFSGLPSSTLTRYGASVSLSYLLWDFGTRSGQLDQAKFELAAAHLSQDQTVQDVILQVEQAYYQVLGLQAVVEANGQSLKDAETNLAAARDRKTSGVATLGDVYKAEAAYAGAQLALQQAEGQLAGARGQLAAAIGDSPDTPFTVASWEQEPTPMLPSRAVGDLIADARDARPDLLAAKARERSAAANINATRGRGLPNLNLNVPLFAGFGDRAAVRQAEAQLDTARATTDDLRSQVELQVWQAYQDLRTAGVTLDSSAAQLKSAQLAADVSTARYKSGLDTVLDVLSAQTTLANARVQ